MSRGYRASLIERFSYLIFPEWEVEKEERAYREYLKGEERKLEAQYKANRCPNAKIKQFRILGALRKCAFGFVVQAVRRRRLYAAKVMIHGKIKRSAESYVHEKKLQYAMNSDFIVQLNFAFKHGRNLYLVKEYPKHGDLRWQLTQTYVREPVLQVYAAQIVLAIEYLHACNIIHRDLKEENIWLFADGYVKLADFEFAVKRTMAETSPSGTLLYTAPEVLRKESFESSSDWWSFGVLLFSILFVGFKPYGSETRTTSAEQLLDEISGKELNLPKLHRPVSVEGRDIIKRLLQEDVGIRLCGANPVKRHAWFRNLNFFKIRLKRLEMKTPLAEVAEKIEPLSPSLVPGPDDKDILTHGFEEF